MATTDKLSPGAKKLALLTVDLLSALRRNPSILNQITLTTATREALAALTDEVAKVLHLPQQPAIPKWLHVELQVMNTTLKRQAVATLGEASKAVRAYLDEMNVGASQWIGGDVRLGGKVIARVSYNGSVWAKTGANSTDEVTGDFLTAVRS